MNSASPELLTTDQVIDRLLLDANLRRVAATCVLPAVRWGNDWRFRRTDLEEWIRRQQSGASDCGDAPFSATD
jgi:excisionase family DNA binding protein